MKMRNRVTAFCLFVLMICFLVVSGCVAESGLGQEEITEPFHHNTWEHAAEDFQKTADGALDYEMIDPIVVEMYCSGCWR